MSASDLLVFVETGRDALDGAAIVGEHDRRAMPANLVADEAIDRRPDRFLRQRPKLLDGTDDAQIEVLAQPGIDDCHGAWMPVTFGIRFAATEIAGDFFQRTLRRRQADAHETLQLQRLQTL